MPSSLLVNWHPHSVCNWHNIKHINVMIHTYIRWNPSLQMSMGQVRLLWLPHIFKLHFAKEVHRILTNSVVAHTCM